MKREYALRYLLLRHFKQVQRGVDPGLFDEVTRSLHVSRDSESYLVQWTARGEADSRRFASTDFSFYQRGDTEPESRAFSEDLSTNNDTLARAFALEVFAIHPPVVALAVPDKDAISWTILVAHTAVLVLVMALGYLGIASGAVLFAIECVEHGARGRLYASFLFVVLAFIAPGAAVMGGAAYATLQFLDPDPTARTLRIVSSVAAVVAGLGVLGMAGGPGAPFGPALGFFIAAAAIAAFRSLLYTHQRAVPLALPFLWAGFALDGPMTLPVAGLCLSAGETLATGFWSRSRNTRTPTPAKASAPVVTPPTQELKWHRTPDR